jgi:pimeloyl-ACP methyl ester carboxylesterase
MELGGLEVANVHFLDLPGHGRSSGQGRNDIAAYADVVDAFIAEMGLRQVALIGHSMGGATVLTVAQRQPAWLDALVLVGTGARLRVMPSLLDMLPVDFPAAVEIMCSAMFGPKAPASLIESERERYSRVDWRVVRDDLVACDAFDVMTVLGRIKVPTLVVAGANDRLTPVKYSEYLAQGIPKSQLTVFADAGHMLAREQPEAFTRAVGDFLRKL